MKTEKVMKVSFITNFLLSCFKVINGFILKSSALIADGIHSFSDLITDMVAIIGDKFANKPNDSEHPYGHGNAEYLTSFIIGLMIIFMGLILIKETIYQDVTIPSCLVAVVSLITIVCKYFLASFLIKKGELYNNNILIASGKESKTDVISSIVVFLSSILILFRNYLDILKYSDKVAGVVVGIFIIVTGFKIVKENTVMILGKKADDTELRNKLLTIPNILNVDDIIMIKYGPYYKAYVEVTMNIKLLKKAHDMAHNIENEIKNELTNIKYINIHVNPK
mgnify:FL=1